jgi:hypothetical protein
MKMMMRKKKTRSSSKKCRLTKLNHRIRLLKKQTNKLKMLYLIRKQLRPNKLASLKLSNLRKLRKRSGKRISLMLLLKKMDQQKLRLTNSRKTILRLMMINRRVIKISLPLKFLLLKTQRPRIQLLNNQIPRLMSKLKAQRLKKSQKMNFEDYYNK